MQGIKSIWLCILQKMWSLQHQYQDTEFVLVAEKYFFSRSVEQDCVQSLETGFLQQKLMMM